MRNSNRLSGKVAIITGGATGIGEAISKKFAQEGAIVIVNGYPEDPVTDVVSSIITAGGMARPFIADISIPQNAEACIKYTVETCGKLDILINNAGVFPVMSEISEYPDDAFEYLLKNNIKSAYYMTKFAIPHLKSTKGNIVFAGSEAGEKGQPQNAVYGGTKGFLHAFMKGVALEQAKYGIRANCVCPGPIDTAWTHKETGPMNKKMEHSLISSTPMGRRGTPEEVANVYLFLASDEASYITAGLFPVDGGVTAAKGPIGDEVGNDIKKQPDDTLGLKHGLHGASNMIRGSHL